MINSSEKKLASRLLYLPLDLGEKVLLWLAYKELKPVSEITVIRRHCNNNRNNSKIKKVKKWIKDAGMFYTNDGKNITSWHVSKDKSKTVISAKILHRFDYESECQSGILLGYPKESAEAYAFNRNVKLGEDQIPMIWPGLKYIDPSLKDKNYTPYIFYAIRADKLIEAGKTAQLWANTIRKETPLLAKWFEKLENLRKKEEIESEERQKIFLKRNKQKIREILEEYSRGEKATKGIFLKALKEYNYSLLSEFKFASVCHLLLKHNDLSGEENKDLIKILKLGESFYRPGKSRPKTLAQKDKQLFDWYNKNK